VLVEAEWSDAPVDRGLRYLKARFPAYDPRNADLLYQDHLPQRRLCYRPHRPPHPPLRHHRDRRRFLPPSRGRGRTQTDDYKRPFSFVEDNLVKLRDPVVNVCG